MYYNPVINARTFQELQNMTTILSRQPKLIFDFQYGSTIDVQNNTLTASRFWRNYDDDIEKTGYKTDVLLRSLGTFFHTSMKEWKRTEQQIAQSTIPNFHTQLFTLLEDLRLEELIRRERRGTRHWFDLRKKVYTHYFETQLETNILRNFKTDELFCLIYLTVTASSPFIDFPNANTEQVETMKRLHPLLIETYEATATKDIRIITENIASIAQHHYSDSINTYFVAPVKNDAFVNSDWLVDHLRRADELSQDDRELLDDEKEIINEKFSTWHRENENKDRSQSFLRYELEHGTKTNLLGDGARDSEAGDQAMASVQGTSAQSEQKDYSKLETLNEKKNNNESTKTNRYGEENINAVKRLKHPDKPTLEQHKTYNLFVKEVSPIIKQLKRTIEKALENKQNETRTQLLYGRLSKKQLLPLIIDDNPRVFHKKDSDSNEIDATFTLLIDCSASMENKMEDTKKAAIIFHEVLKQLAIPHQVIGFWEDSFESSHEEQPNYFHRVIPVEKSLDNNAGPEILQLQAEEDNRDGFAIRIAAEQLNERFEKHKFLLVFSDGEPSAFNYRENGIIDTYNAVKQSRKYDIDCIGIYLSNEAITEEEEILMQNIYGKDHLLIPNLTELPYLFAYMIKRLLLKTL